MIKKTAQDILRTKIHNLAKKSGSHTIKRYNKVALKCWRASNLVFLAVMVLIVTKIIPLHPEGLVLYFGVAAWWGFCFVFLERKLSSLDDFEKKNNILSLIEKRPDLAELLRPAFLDMAGDDLSYSWYHNMNIFLGGLLKEEKIQDCVGSEDREFLKNKAKGRVGVLLSGGTENNTVCIYENNGGESLETETRPSQSAPDIARERWKI